MPESASQQMGNRHQGMRPGAVGYDWMSEGKRGIGGAYNSRDKRKYQRQSAPTSVTCALVVHAEASDDGNMRKEEQKDM